jgi:hypothetical protein
MGAPGYTPHSELPPHTPMPGAPPYPERLERPPQVGGPRTGTGFPRVLAAVSVWAAVHVVLVGLLPDPVAPGRFGAGLVLSTLLAALAGWLWARRRRCPFWLLLLAVAPVFWVLRALVTVPLG